MNRDSIDPTQGRRRRRNQRERQANDREVRFARRRERMRAQETAEQLDARLAWQKQCEVRLADVEWCATQTRVRCERAKRAHSLYFFFSKKGTTH